MLRSLKAAALAAVLALAPVAALAADLYAFEPRMPSGAVNLSVSTSSANVALPTGKPRQVLLTTGSSDAVIFVEFCPTSSCTASTSTSIKFNPGAQTMTVPFGATYIAAIASTGTATLNIAPGEGV